MSHPSPATNGRPVALIALAVVLLIAFFALSSSLGSVGSWVFVVAAVLVVAAAARWTWTGAGR